MIALNIFLVLYILLDASQDAFRMRKKYTIDWHWFKDLKTATLFFFIAYIMYKPIPSMVWQEIVAIFIYMACVHYLLFNVIYNSLLIPRKPWYYVGVKSIWDRMPNYVRLPLYGLSLFIVIVLNIYFN